MTERNEVPQLKIISPTDNQTILGDKITISFIVSDFNIGQDGYINLWLDNPIQEASNAAKITSQFDYTLSDLPSGSHKLTLEVIKSNHLSFKPKVNQSVSFTSILPQVSTITAIQKSRDSTSSLSYLNWQQILLIASVVIIAVGLIIKYIWGRPQIWR